MHGAWCMVHGACRIGEERVLLTVVRQRGWAVSALFPEIGGKSDRPALGRGRVHELADRREDGGDGLIMGGELLLEARLELIEAAGERPVRSPKPLL